MSPDASTDKLATNCISKDSGKQPSNEELDSKAPPRVRIARYDQYFNQRTFSVSLRKTSRSVNHRKLNKKRPVLTVRRIINERGQLDSIEIDVKSQALCEVLLDINQDVMGLSFTKSEPIADMNLLFHSRIGLRDRLVEEKSKESPDGELIEDIETALQFIIEDHGRTIADFSELTLHGEITFKLLWALFPPNTLVYRYHHFTEQPQVLLARSFAYGSRQGTPYAEIICEVVTNDGNAFGITRDSLAIKVFPGRQKITDLSVYPLEYHEDKMALCELAIIRGKKFAKINRQCFEISGPAFGERDNMLGDPKVFKFITHGRVMIDPAAFRLFQPNSEINSPVYRRLEQDSLKDDELLICTPIVLGFCFGTKMWGGFALDRLTDVAWSDEPFKQLVLGEKQKQLIHALIRQHSTRATCFDDIVVGKGKGLIGLLCGNPGCGKTLTAEAAAEITHSPLYVVSAGELGTQPEELDKRLTLILELAQLWKAVLLLDEAEVFLQARSTTDVARNALVSIFLRQLEYYQGILILTTNMIGQCDPAFESRIHFCIKYPDLDLQSRKAIWKTFFNKALDNPDDVSEEDLDRLSRNKMNGRQIKNAVSSAQSIALDQKSRLLVEHVDTVLEVVNDWHLAKEDTSLL